MVKPPVDKDTCMVVVVLNDRADVITNLKTFLP